MSELKDLIVQKNKLVHDICELEFEGRGFKERLKKLQISYKLYYRTPTGKHSQWQISVGIPIKEFNKLLQEKILIIIGLTNPREIDTNLFYVFNFKEGKGGTSNDHEYIDIKRRLDERWKCLLPTIEEYLDEKEKETKE